MKATTLVALLAHQYDVRPPGYEAELPAHPTLAQVTTREELQAYQAGKREAKKAARDAAAARSTT
jgi:hypothetical protein